MVADIFEKVSIGSTTEAITGSSFDITRLTRKSIFVAVATGQSGTGTTDITVNIEASPNNSDWFSLDSKAYASGTATSLDVFSYNSHFPHIRTTTTNVTPASGASIVSTTITGRGV